MIRFLAERTKHIFFTVRFTILTIFVTLFVISLLSFIAITYHRFSDDMSDVALKLMKKSAEAAFDDLIEVELDHSASNTRFTASLFQRKVLKVNDFSQVALFETNILNEETLPLIQSIYFGDEEGNLVVSSKEGKQITTHVLHHASANYDPRERPWYIAAKKAQKTIWTDIYTFLFAQELGTTIATPIYVNQKFSGVISLNIRLDYLRKYLEATKISKNSYVYIVNTEGTLIAFPGITQYNKPRAELLSIQSLSIPWVTQSFNEYMKTKKAEFKFYYKGEDYLAAFTPIPQVGNKNWLIGIVAPEDDFTGELRQTNIIILIVGLIILLVGIVLVSALITRVVKPLKQLAQETEKIKNFQLENDSPIKTRIKEVHVLSSALYAMKKGLRSFQKYVPAALVRQLIATGEVVRISGKKRKLAILFTDIEDFTSISEKTDPKLLVEHLCNYFEVLTHSIVENQGTIDKFIGDSVMAFWGAPYPDPKSAVHAAKAAIEISRQLKTLNQTWIKEGKPAFITRIGIHLGDAIVGNIGSSDRLNYTVIGDAPNIASRLENINKLYGTQIIVSEEIYHAIKNQFELREIDRVILKGRKESTAIYELLGEK